MDYLNTRHQAGCENASQLWRKIRQQGFSGSKRQVLKWMREKRLTPACSTLGRYLEAVRLEKATTTQTAEATSGLPSAKQLVWLFIQEPVTSQVEETPPLARVLQDEEVAHVYGLARAFMDMVRYKRPEELDSWLEACAASSVKAV